MKDSTHKGKIDPVKITQSKDNTDIGSKSPKQCPRRTPQRSAYPGIMKPKPISIGAHQKGITMGREWKM